MESVLYWSVRVDEKVVGLLELELLQMEILLNGVNLSSLIEKIGYILIRLNLFSLDFN
jgi:hypothetical protein